MEQITLSFDGAEFDSFEGLHDYYSHTTRSVRGDDRRAVKQCVQAMEMDYSPSQWSQKVNRSNNTSVNLEDLDKFTELYGDVRWIYYAIDKHIIKRGNKNKIAELKATLARLEAEEALA